MRDWPVPLLFSFNAHSMNQAEEMLRRQVSEKQSREDCTCTARTYMQSIRSPPSLSSLLFSSSRYSALWKPRSDQKIRHPSRLWVYDATCCRLSVFLGSDITGVPDTVFPLFFSRNNLIPNALRLKGLP